MASTMSQSEMSETIRALVTQVGQLSTALDTANTNLAALQQTCDRAWSAIDVRVKTVEGNIATITARVDNSGGGSKHHMKLVKRSQLSRRHSSQHPDSGWLEAAAARCASLRADPRASMQCAAKRLLTGLGYFGIRKTK